MNASFGQFDLTSDKVTAARWSGVMRFRMNGRSVMQVVQAIRAASAVPFDRMNDRNVITFTAMRSFTKLVDCEWFSATHKLTLPRKDTLKLICGDGTSATKTLYIPGAFLEVVETSFEGTLATINYSFTGGRIWLTDPTLATTNTISG